MRKFAPCSLAANNATRAIIVLASVRLFQLATSFGGGPSASADLGERIVEATHLSLAVFLIAPLFVAFALPALRAYFHPCAVLRMGSRAVVLERYCVDSARASIGYSALVVAGSVLLAVAQGCEAPGATGAAVVLLTLLLQTLFFMACSLVAFAAECISGSKGIAAVSVFLYAVWDFVVTNTPFIPLDVVAGWSLTQVRLPLEIQAVSVQAAGLMAVLAAAYLFSWLSVRICDLSG